MSMLLRKILLTKKLVCVMLKDKGVPQKWWVTTTQFLVYELRAQPNLLSPRPQRLLNRGNDQELWGLSVIAPTDGDFCGL
jgi:hypothetical protein